MAQFMTREEFRTPAGRRRAERSLFWDDHGFLRTLYDNSHQVSPRMWRTYQPSPADLVQWAEKGIRTVINLRGTRRQETQDGVFYLEEEMCEKLGMEFIPYRAYSREAPTREFILGLDDIFQRIDYPAILHCKSGADRAGISATLFAFLHEARPLDEALVQMSFRYGHVREGKTGVLDHFFDVYREAAARDGVPPSRDHFLSWVNSDYDKDAVQASFKPTALGSLLTERILRRE